MKLAVSGCALHTAERRGVTLLVACISLFACQGGTRQPTTPETTTAATTPIKPSWYALRPKTNPIDGVKTQNVILSANENSKDSRQAITLTVSFDNGRLATKHVGIFVNAGGMVEPLSYEYQHSTSVRLKFDDEKPVRQTWTITDSDDALAPRDEKGFLTQLLNHQKLALEFSYYHEVPDAFTFDISGLSDVLEKAGLQDAMKVAVKVKESVPDKMKKYCETNPSGFYGAPGTDSGVSCPDWLQNHR